MMNRNPEHHPHTPTEHVAAAFCGDAFVERDSLRQLLSELGLHADSAQENTLLELIHESHSRKQCLVTC